jgi:hypothetical protein
LRLAIHQDEEILDCGQLLLLRPGVFGGATDASQ